VDEAADGGEALVRFEALSARDQPDLVVLDIGLPEMDGFEVCRALRRQGDVPILFLSSRDDELDRVLGLELGGDDYVVKPFSPRELVARIKRILARGRGVPSRVTDPDERSIERGSLRLDVDRHRCTWAGDCVELTVKEFGLLQSLCGMPGKVYTRDELVERAYGAGHHITDRTIDSHIRRIRKKLRSAGGDPIETIYGLGYRLREGQEPPP
jgi:two-component system OmpR family response regulator